MTRGDWLLLILGIVLMAIISITIARAQEPSTQTQTMVMPWAQWVKVVRACQVRIAAPASPNPDGTDTFQVSGTTAQLQCAAATLKGVPTP